MGLGGDLGRLYLISLVYDLVRYFEVLPGVVTVLFLGASTNGSGPSEVSCDSVAISIRFA